MRSSPRRWSTLQCNHNSSLKARSPVPQKLGGGGRRALPLRLERGEGRGEVLKIDSMVVLTAHLECAIQHCDRAVSGTASSDGNHDVRRRPSWSPIWIVDADRCRITDRPGEFEKLNMIV